MNPKVSMGDLFSRGGYDISLDWLRSMRGEFPEIAQLFDQMSDSVLKGISRVDQFTRRHGVETKQAPLWNLGHRFEKSIQYVANRYRGLVNQVVHRVEQLFENVQLTKQNRIQAKPNAFWMGSDGAAVGQYGGKDSPFAAAMPKIIQEKDGRYVLDPGYISMN